MTADFPPGQQTKIPITSMAIRGVGSMFCTRCHSTQQWQSPNLAVSGHDPDVVVDEGEEVAAAHAKGS
jgi:hypothetical protein